jgi:nicotinamide-nucleotide amidase
LNQIENTFLLQNVIKMSRNKLFNLLTENKLTMATAESMTGGLLATGIIELSGASKIFDSCFVTYSEDCKKKVLGVKTDDIYSHQCVREMAEGVRKLRPEVNVILATSGYAEDPGDGIEMGTYLCVLLNDNEPETLFITHPKMRTWSRKDVREYVVEQCYKTACKTVEDYNLIVQPQTVYVIIADNTVDREMEATILGVYLSERKAAEVLLKYIEENEEDIDFWFEDVTDDRVQYIMDHVRIDNGDGYFYQIVEQIVEK